MLEELQIPECLKKYDKVTKLAEDLLSFKNIGDAELFGIYSEREKKIIVSPKYTHIYPHSNNKDICVVREKDMKLGLFSKKNHLEILPTEYLEIKHLRGCPDLMVISKENNERGFFDLTNEKILLESKYIININHFMNSFIIVHDPKSNLYGLFCVEKKEIILETKYKSMEFFTEDFVRVGKNKKEKGNTFSISQNKFVS